MDCNRPLSCLWSASRLHVAVHQLGRRSGFAKDADSPPPFPTDGTPEDDTLVNQWTDLAAAHLKIEIIPSGWKYSETAEMLRCIGPALIRLPGDGEPRFLAVLKGRSRSLTVLTPDRKQRRIPQAMVRDALTRSLREEAACPASRILKQAGISSERGQHSLNAIVDEQLSSHQMRGCWLFRLSPGSEG